jgi:putative oxidoreductase
MVLQFLDRYRDLGLLLLRVGIGCSIAFAHGWGKLTGGVDTWVQYGQTLDALLGIGFLPAFWGFMAAVAEFFGGLLVACGLLFRPALALLVINMAVAAGAHATGVIEGSPWHAIDLGIVFLALVLIGPGRYSFDERFSATHTARRASRF